MALNNSTGSRRSTNWIQIQLGIFALILGVIVYVLERPAEHVYFLPQFISMYERIPSVLGQIGFYLPAFLHVMAFSLIVAGVIGCNKREGVVICIAWMLVNGAFEIGQHEDIAPGIVELLPEWFFYVPILDNTASYFLHGVYDPYDLLSIVAGALVAYVVIILTIKHKIPSHII